MKALEFQEKLKDSFLKYFPNGSIRIGKLSLGGGISIFCGLIGDINDVSNKIRMNDPLTVRAYIHDDFTFNDTEKELDKVVITFDGSWVSVKPDNKMMYCQSHKIASRKINADAVKAVDLMDKYFSRVKTVVSEQIANNNIIAQENILEKYL